MGDAAVPAAMTGGVTDVIVAFGALASNESMFCVVTCANEDTEAAEFVPEIFASLCLSATPHVHGHVHASERRVDNVAVVEREESDETAAADAAAAEAAATAALAASSCCRSVATSYSNWKRQRKNIT